jgi:peptidoglycan lytic transglycosylase D
MKNSLLIVALLFFQFNIVSAQSDSTQVEMAFVEDSPVAIMLDSLAKVKYFGDYKFLTDTNQLNKFGYSPNEVPTFTDSVLRHRIEELNKTTTIELTFNRTVKNYIKLYAERKRALTSKMLGLSEIYFPLFEEHLDRFDMPLELKYLAIVESALNPTAGSHAGAKGLWQFMYGTGKVYGLKVNTLIDERYDPLQATIAACQHLSDLHDIYDDWSLAMAAYNSGAGNVNKAVRRAGHVKNYWSVWPFLPRETRGYVPAFTAVTYIMNYASEHNLYPIEPGVLFYEIDSVEVCQPLSFDQISELLKIPIKDLKFLNPMFKKDIIPAEKDKKFVLRLPTKYIGDFINNEEALYNYKSTSGLARDKVLAEIEKAKSRRVHIVRSGDNLGAIANRYRCYISQLKRWNNLRGSTIYPGQKLIVFSPFNQSYSSSKGKPIKRSGDKSKHIVRNGENLGAIAKKYKCSVTDIKEWNGLRGNTIQPKQKLIVYKPEIAPKLEKGQKYLYYTIKKGDTLWDIAKLYDGVTVDRIKLLNGIKNTKRLKPGQKIKVAVAG